MKTTVIRSIIPLLGSAILGASLCAQETDETAVVRDLWNTPDIFPPEFFPEADTLTKNDIFIEGLKSYFPNRVYRERPELNPGPDTEPRIENMMAGVTYIRVYNLASALPILERELPNGTLVIDLRNVQADRDRALQFCSLLAIDEGITLSLIELHQAEDSDATGETLAIEPAVIRRPLQPVFTLTNRDTAGPVEAVLAELKDRGQIISIGTSTAGRTGSFRRVMEDPSLYVLSGELRPGSGVSLLKTGFVPSVNIAVSPDDDRAAYQAMEDGKSLRALVRSENDHNSDDLVEALGFQELLEQDDTPSEEDAGIVDPILQRAYFIATALKSIGKIPAPESN